jgi:cell wall-associated NlpC family hydrolase
VTTRTCARHRAERTPLSTFTGALRAVAVDAPKGAGRSAVVVATAGGIVVSSIAPAAADPAPETGVDLQVHVAKLSDQAREALEIAPVVEVSQEAVVDVERVSEEGVVPITVTPAPPPPPPPAPRAAAPARTATASRTSERPAAPSGTWGAAAEIALRYVGVRYVFGGATPNGFDCSGLVVYTFRQLGVDLPHQSTRIRDSSRTVRIPRSEARPGDIIWSPGHVSIYLGGGRQVEATRPGGWTVRTANIWQSNPMFLRVV